MTKESFTAPMSGLGSKQGFSHGSRHESSHESSHGSRHWSSHGLCFVLSSPSGGGKTTVARQILREADAVALSISATTRPQRGGEQDGQDYYFIDEAEFRRREEAGWFLETATVFGNLYGTPRQEVEGKLTQGISVLFDIDWQGAKQIREQLGQETCSIFLLPPSFEVLSERLHKRARESGDDIQRRLQMALQEMTHWNEYDYVIVNETLEHTVQQVHTILRVERSRRIRQQGLGDFVEKLGHK